MMLFAHSATPSGFSAPFQYANSPAETEFAAIVVRFFQDGLARISAPLLGYFSGYLGLLTYRNSGALPFVAKRFRKLYVPAVFWSVIFVVVIELIGWGRGNAGYARQITGEIGFGTFFGVHGWPANSPLHYLVDLFKCALILPLLMPVIRKFGLWGAGFLVFGGAVFLVLSDLNTWHPGLNQASFLPRSDLFVFFFAGVFAAYQGHGVLDWAERAVLAMPAPRVVAMLVIFCCTSMSWQYVASIGTVASSLSAYGLLMVTRIVGSGLVIYFFVTLKAKWRGVVPWRGAVRRV